MNRRPRGRGRVIQAGVTLTEMLVFVTIAMFAVMMAARMMHEAISEFCRGYKRAIGPRFGFSEQRLKAKSEHRRIS